MEKQTNLTKEEFIERHCRSCGSQRCEGVDFEWFDGCKEKDGVMMHVSKAEFIGGKEADDAYKKLCELTGLEWDTVIMCEDAMPYCDMVFECSVCGNIDTDGKPKYCSECGAKISQ